MKKVLTFMVADMFHIGHLNLLIRAKSLGDYLMVGIASSWTIQEHIKYQAPIINAEDRLRIVQSIKEVDFAFIYTDTVALNESIVCLKPDIICRGDDNKNFVGKEMADLLGIEIVYFPYTPGISSSKLRGEI